MPVLSDLRSRHPVGVPEARALLTLPILAAAADGRMEPGTLSRILTICADVPVFGRLGPAVAEQLAKAILESIQRQGAVVALQQAQADLPEGLRETALCLALRICLDGGGADGGPLDTETRDALAQLAHGFGVDAARLAQMEDVLSLLTRDPVG